MGNTNRLRLRDDINAWLQTADPDEETIDVFLQGPEHISDVFDCLGPLEIKAMVEEKTTHLEKLLDRTIEGMRRFAHGEIHGDPKYVLNCLRFVTRIMAIVLAYGQQVEDLLWGNKGLALEIVEAVMGLCFCAKFTTPVRDADISLSELIWYSGLAREQPSSISFEANRIEVLRCLLACCVETIYTSQSALQSYRNPWIWLWACKDLRHTKALFFSLLNAVLGYQTEGWFGSVYSASRDLVQLCAHLLMVLIDSQIPSFDMIQQSPTLQKVQRSVQKLHTASEGPLSGSTHLSLVQVYSQQVRELSDPLDFDYIAKNLIRLLKTARTDPFLVEESLVLLWEFIELNPKFEAYICEETYATELYKSLLFFMWTHYKDPQKIGLVQICSFLLLHLSSGKSHIVRTFCISLSDDYQKDLGLEVPNGVDTLSDLLITFTHSFIVANPDLISLISCLVTVMRNVSAYTRSVGTLPSVQVTSIFKMFSSPKVLASDPLYLQLISALLDFLDTRIQYHWDVTPIQGSIHLIYALLMRREVFERFFSATLEDPAAEASLEMILKGHAVDTIKALFTAMDPLVQELEKKYEQVTEPQVLSLLLDTTLVGVLPSPHSILIHRFRANQDTQNWVQTFIWAVIFISLQSLQLFNTPCVQLFQVKHRDS